ncbi:amino acid adenylation domain-containing protein, partial [Tenacibaculum sp.]|nr:amino acid adenylation domain-containing protein [Tenacibaculum sp.]
NQPIGKLSILTNEEETKLVEVFNDNAVSYPVNNTVVDLFMEQVRNSPEAIAIFHQGEELSYKDLDNLSNQLAHYLLSNYTINKEDLISVSLERSDWLIVSYIAILKTGAAYVPIDPGYPEERKAYILSDSGSKFLIEASLIASFKEKISDYSEILPSVSITPSDLAYVIYTSGSTGKPKGVLIEHKNLVNLCFWHQSEYSVSASSRGTLFAGIGFDASVWEIYPYLLKGASLYPVSDNIRYDLNLFSAFLKDYRISHAYIPTIVCENLIEEEVKLPEITILTGGDTLKLTKGTDLKIYNNYGPTETTVVATSCQVGPRETSMLKPPIGTPIDNTQVYILNEEEKILPIGAVGELCIGGSGVGRGYLNNPELTKEKFISNPFNKSGSIYKTGDLARWLSDGVIEFIGRKDNQVKIRGYRIELGEIEKVLSGLDLVTQCCVLAKEDSNKNKRLVGYLVLQDDLDKEVIEKELHNSLPDYMVPKLWISLEEMPLTSNGKLDRKALPEPDISELSTQEYVAPRNEDEEQLAIIWQELLGIEKIGIHDDFFELGGHSLLVIKLVANINETFNSNINVINVFEYPTISEFLEKMPSSEQTFDTNLLVALKDKGNQKPIFFTPPGGGLYSCYIDLAKQLGEDQPVYAFQCPGINGELPISESIEAMASDFIREMQKVDSQGPYRLGGYSFGAVVAYEMALQLKAKGFEIEELLIFDSSLLDTHTQEIEDVDTAFREFLLDQMESFVEEDFDWSSFDLKGKSKKEQLDAVCELAKDIKIDVVEEEVRGFFEVFFTNETYKYFIRNEGKLDTKIVLFKAMNMVSELKNGETEIVPNTEYKEFDYDWSRYTN